MSLVKYNVFLSHSHEDVEPVEKIARCLEDQENLKVWLDKWVLIPGGKWQQAMAKGLDEAESCAVCIGEKTPKGWFREEIERAINRQTKNENFRVIPVLLPNADKSNVDNFLELRTWVDFTQGLSNNLEFHRLVCGIKNIPPGRGPQEKRDDKNNTEVFKKMLLQLHEFRTDGLVDGTIAVEYQRKVLDIWWTGFKCEGD